MKVKSKEHILRKMQKNYKLVKTVDVFMGIFVTVSFIFAFLSGKSIFGIMLAFCVYSLTFMYTVKTLEADIEQCKNEIEEEKELK